MDFLKLEELLFGEGGACVSDNDNLCKQQLEQALKWLENVDSSDFTTEEYINLANVIIRFSMCSVSYFHKIPEYGEVMSLLYQLAIDSPYYEEREF